MADKLCLGEEVRELKLGSSFFNKSTSFHTIRYDFKPASVDLSKVATVDVGSGKQVTVTVPHLDGADISHTVFKGSQRPYQKQCVLIYDKTTGEVTLEKLTYNFQVKKTRMESVQKSIPPLPPTSTAHSSIDIVDSSHNDARNSLTITTKQKKTQKSHHAPSSISGCIPQHSPLHASPSSRSPTRPLPKSPPHSNSLLGSLPIIGMDDLPELEFGDGNKSIGSQLQQQETAKSRHSPKRENNIIEKDKCSEIGIMPDSSSDSSSYSDSSDSDSESEIKSDKDNGLLDKVIDTNVNIGPTASHLLKDDLQLSESGSDSD